MGLTISSGATKAERSGGSRNGVMTRFMTRPGPETLDSFRNKSAASLDTRVRWHAGL